MNGQTLLVDSADLGLPSRYLYECVRMLCFCSVGASSFNFLPVVIGGSVFAGILFVLVGIAVVVLAVYWKK